MAAEGAFPLAGRMFVGADAGDITQTDGTGGTELTEIANREITFLSGQRTVAEYLNKRKVRYADVMGEALLVVRLLEMTPLALKMRYPHVTADGITFGPDLGTKDGQEHPEYEVLIRPEDGTDGFYFFCPKMQVDVDSDDGWIWSPETFATDSELILACSNEDDESEPDWRIGTTSTLVSAYAQLTS